MPLENTSSVAVAGAVTPQVSATPSPGQSVAAAPVSSPSTTPQTPSTPAQQTPGSTGQVAATGSQASGQPPDGQQPAPQTQAASWIQSLRQRGVNLPEAEDQAMQQIQTWMQQQNEFQQHVPFYRSYLQNRDAFTQFMQQQAASRQQAQPTGQDQNDPYWASVWKPPVEFNPLWLSQIQRDPTTGNLIGPPDIVAKYEQYAAYQRERQQEFWQNPVKFMEPAVRHLAAEVAQQMVGQHLGQYQDAQRSMAFVNSPENIWLYERDPNTGAPVVASQWNPQTGAMENLRVLSPEGRRFAELINIEHRRQAERKYYDLHEQQEMAMLRLRAELSQRQQTIQQPVNPAMPAPQQTPLAAANAQFMQQHGGQQPAQLATPGNRQQAQHPVTRANFQQALAERFEKIGYKG